MAAHLERRPPLNARKRLKQLDFTELAEPRAQASFARSVVQRVRGANSARGDYTALAEAVQAEALE